MVEVCGGDGSLMASGVIVHALKAFDNNLWKACDTALGIGDSLDLTDMDCTTMELEDVRDYVSAVIEKEKWVTRAIKFTNNYLEGIFAI